MSRAERGIALCITDLEVGGAERCLAQLAARVDRTRFEPVVFCLGERPARAERSCVPLLEAAGVEVRFLGARHRGQFPWIVRRLTGLLREASPQVLHSFLFHANLVGRLAAQRARVPRVVSAIRVAERHSRWHLRLDRWTHRWVDRYACVSQAVAEFTASQGGIPRDKLAVVPNGIDLTGYPAREPASLLALDIPEGRRIVTFVGRLDRQKGVRWLIESAPGWLERLPDCDLLLVGDGPLRGELERIAAGLAAGRRIHFAGFRSDVPQILAASRLFVLPSQWEGMPNAVLEAMASGLPVVATRAEGVPELLGPGAGEQTVEYGDSQALGERVVAIMTSAELAGRLGSENRVRAEQSFSISAMVSAHEDLWESLLE